MSSDFLYIKWESKGQFKALQHILRKVNIIVLAFHSLSTNNLYGQSNELVESISLMCLCIQQKVCALIKTYLLRPAHPLIAPVNPLLPGSFLYFRIPSRLSFVRPQPCQKCIHGTTGTLGGDSVVKVVAMETRHRRNVAKLFKEKLSFIFFYLHPLFCLRNCLLGGGGHVSDKNGFSLSVFLKEAKRKTPVYIFPLPFFPFTFLPRKGDSLLHPLL